jgi:predicted NBD/HSP70 family sugar kinase
LRRLNLKKAKAASSSTIRDINRQIVLNFIRDREPLSRADIARESALQRSTVSDIVEKLKADGLIEEIGAGQSTGGRRPTLLRVRAAGATAIGVDITPTRTTVVKSDLAGRVLESREFLTSPQRDKTLQRVIKSVCEITGDSAEAIEGIGVSLPGLVDPDEGCAIYVPYFKWRAWPIAEELSRATNLPVTVDNDANTAALAELWFGRPEISVARDFIMVLVAEGIGTGVIFDGQIYRGEHNAAGEFGHMIVGQKGPVRCSCGNQGCWEAFASGRAAMARYRNLSGSNERASIGLAQLVDRANNGEEAAITALTETAHYLGIGISNLIVGLSPEAVVVGGVIARVWPLITDAVKETIEHSIRRGLPPVSIVASTLGDQPSLLGALSLVLASKFASVPVG